MNNKLSSALCLFFIFFWMFPVAEFLFFEPNNNEFGSAGLGLFVLSQTTSIIIALLFCYRCSLFNIKSESPSLFFDEIYVSKVTFIAACLFFLVFLSFYIVNLEGFADIPFFAERYRNGYYKGSGGYTVGVLQFLPVALSLLIAKCKKMNMYIYVSLLLLMLASFLLGQRIYLLMVLFFLMTRLMSSKKKLPSQLLMVFFVLFFVSYKIFLNDDLSQRSIIDIFLHVAGRIRYRYLVYNSNFGYDFNQAFGFIFPAILDYTSTALAQWKENFALSIPNIMRNMSFISLFSGLAFPLPVVAFNVFGFFGFIFVVPFVVFFVYFLKCLYEEGSLFKSILYLYFVYFSLSVLIEDVAQFSKIPLMVLLLISVYLYFSVIQRKINFHN